jgi:hypothetical protein
MKRTLVASTIAVIAGGLAVPALAAPKGMAATSLSIKAAKTHVAADKPDTISGTLRSGKTRLAGEMVFLEKLDATTKTYLPQASMTTDKKGTVSFSVVPSSKKGKARYELMFAGDASYKGSQSRSATVTVS